MKVGMETALLNPPAAKQRQSRPRARPPARRTQAPARRFLADMSPLAWVLADALIIGLAAAAACKVLTLATNQYTWLASPWLMCLTFCGCVTVAGHVFGLYERATLLARSRIFVRAMLTLSLGVILAFACLTVFFYAHSSRWVGLAVFVVYLLVAIPLRLLAHDVISNSPVRLLCVGARQSIQKLVDLLARPHSGHYHVVGHVRVPHGAARLTAAVQADQVTMPQPAPMRFRSDEEERFQAVCPCVGSLENIVDILHEHQVDEILVASELAFDPVVGQAVAPCLEGRCRVTDQATFVEKLLGEVPVESITAEWFLRADVQNRANYEAVRRVMDVAFAALGLLLTLPLWPLIALAIRLDSRGPALFRQIRVGQHGRYFTIYKFRTMRPDAERSGARWAQQNDPRITRVGRFLRKTRLDELPQLLNILRGDMALVGPRPERPEFVHQLEQILPYYRLRHLIRPGLTGWAQIHYGYGSSVADAQRKLCYDLYYLKHRGLELDVAILFRTVGTFLLGAR